MVERADSDDEKSALTDLADKTFMRFLEKHETYWHAALEIVGESGIPPTQLAAMLVEQTTLLPRDMQFFFDSFISEGEDWDEIFTEISASIIQAETEQRYLRP